MHAASVHPEPGSNSLKNGIYNPLAETTYRFLELAYLSFLLLFRVSKFVRDSFTRTFVFLPSWCSKYLLFNFQRPLTCPQLICCKLVYYTSAISVCQGLFKTFFAFFQGASFCVRPRLTDRLPLHSLSEMLTYYIAASAVCQAVFSIFLKKSELFVKGYAKRCGADFSGDFSKTPFLYVTFIV